MTPANPAPQPVKLPPEVQMVMGIAVVCLGALMVYTGAMAVYGVIAAGKIGLAGAISGAAGAAAAGAGVWCFARGTIRIAKAFIDGDKTPAEIEFENSTRSGAKPFTLQPISQKIFNPRTAKSVKVMRPLKLAPKNTGINP